MSSGSYISVPMRLGLASEQYRSREWQMRCKLRVAIPCVVQDFDPVKQTITAQPVVTEKINVIKDGVPVPTDVELKPLLDVPVVMPRAGGFAMTFPINPGDECLVVFADMCIDEWYQSGGTGNAQLDKRRHDLYDGIAIFGLWSQPRRLQNYNVAAVEIKSEDGNCVITLSDSYIQIAASGAGQITIDPSGGITVIPSGSLPITLQGNVTVTGNLSVGGTFDGKNFLLHTHTGVTTGSGHTGSVT